MHGEMTWFQHVTEGYMHDIYIEERPYLVPTYTSTFKIDMTMLPAELMIIQRENVFLLENIISDY